MAVLNELKPGLDEKLYENALVIEPTQGIKTGMEAGGARPTRVRARRRTTDFTDFTDENENERGLVSSAAFH